MIPQQIVFDSVIECKHSRTVVTVQTLKDSLSYTKHFNARSCKDSDNDIEHYSYQILQDTNGGFSAHCIVSSVKCLKCCPTMCYIFMEQRTIHGSRAYTLLDKPE